MRNLLRLPRRGFRFFHFAFFGPVRFCRIALLALNFRHLTERMFFARYAKQQHAERNSSHAAAEEKSHNALAQLSASARARKSKPQREGTTQFTRRARAGRAAQ